MGGVEPTKKTETRGQLIPPRELFLRDWETSVLPIEHQASDAYKAAIDYSLLGFKSMFILNGGALVALPAIVQTFNATCAQGTIAKVAACFVIGILFAAAATTLSYFVVCAEGVFHWNRREEVAQTILGLYYNTPGHQERVKEAAFKSGKYVKRCTLLRYVAIFCALGSVGAFIRGAYELLNIAL